jgi:hypothetical protein
LGGARATQTEEEEEEEDAHTCWWVLKEVAFQIRVEEEAEPVPRSGSGAPVELSAADEHEVG